MNFDRWEPVYEAILADFGYEREADERARDELAALVGDETLAPSDIPGGRSLAGNSVAIAGAGPSLREEVDVVRSADTVFAASTAADTLRDEGISIDCMVTDLDKNPDTARELTAQRTPVVVHAHGDNIPALHAHVPEFVQRSLLPTTQAAPADSVHNVGGFTDGDRAAFLADHLGAADLVFPGWDFDDPSLDGAKRRKLVWAERLLYWLERIRGDHFDVLDGRRPDLNTAHLSL